MRLARCKDGRCTKAVTQKNKFLFHKTKFLSHNRGTERLRPLASWRIDLPKYCGQSVGNNA